MLTLIVCTIQILMIFNNGTTYNNVLFMYAYVFIIFILSCASTKIKCQAINRNIVIANHNHTQLQLYSQSHSTTVLPISEVIAIDLLSKASHNELRGWGTLTRTQHYTCNCCQIC